MRIKLSLLFVFFLAGCNKEGSVGITSQGVQQSEHGLSGTIYFIDEFFDYYVHDLSSGTTSRPYDTHAISQFMSHDERLHSVVGRHQDRLMLFYEQTGESLIFVDGHSGSYRGQPEISRDNRYLAINDFNPYRDRSQFLIYQIDDNSAEVISGWKSFVGQSTDDISSWAWTSDSQLMVGIQKGIYLAEDLSGMHATRVRDFSPYEVGYMNVSNAGDKIAFTLSTGADAPRYWGTLFVMDIDGANLRQITQEGSGSVASLSWSPDDKYIAFIDYFEFGASNPTYDVDRCPDVYIVPVDVDAPISLREGDFSPAIRLYHKMAGETERKEICAKHSLDWRS